MYSKNVLEKELRKLEAEKKALDSHIQHKIKDRDEVSHKIDNLQEALKKLWYLKGFLKKELEN